MTKKQHSKCRIAIFASGNGSNTQRIVEYFKNHEKATVSLILSNRKDVYVLERAKNLNIPAAHLSKEQFIQGNDVLSLLREYQIDFLALAGFLLLIPKNIIEAFPQKIVNIHPALLPKYGGKGMYGSCVHEAVIANRESESGITIHFVNEKYDDGAYLFQAKCPVLPGDTPEILAQKIHALEYEFFPKIIENCIEKLK